MKGRVDSRALSRQSAGDQPPPSEEVFAVLQDIDRSLGEILEAMERERRPGLPEGTRFAFFKSLALRLMQVYTRGQDAYNQRILEALGKIRRKQTLLEEELRRRQRILSQLQEKRPSGE